MPSLIWNTISSGKLICPSKLKILANPVLDVKIYKIRLQEKVDVCLDFVLCDQQILLWCK